MSEADYEEYFTYDDGSSGEKHPFTWMTMEGEVMTLQQMKTSHIFNSTKMCYNHLAEVYNVPTVWFTKKYADYQLKARQDPKGLAKLIVIFIQEIERRGDLPPVYRVPYREIVEHLLGLNYDAELKLLVKAVESET